MRKLIVAFSALALFWSLAPMTYSADWVYLGEAHVDGQHDHDNIKPASGSGRFRALQLRVSNAPIEFDHIVVHYGNGEAETLQVRNVIPAGGRSRAIPLAGDRIVESFELWYSRADPNSSKPQVALWGRR